MRKFLFIIFPALILSGCKSKHYQINSISGEYIPVVQTGKPDPELSNFVDLYKIKLDKEMNRVIGHSAKYMTTGRPESLLTNLTSDWMLEFDNSQSGEPVELTFMNVHGIRAPIAEGEITVGDIFDAYPFDNILAIVKLEGKYLTEIFESYAQMGGAGVSGNVRMTIENKHLAQVLIDNKPINENKIYTILTLDYLAEGNDGMDAFKKASSITQTGVKLREYMLSKVISVWQSGEVVDANLNGRISIINANQ
ncbi:MAG: 5'-nucleotidase C-terminal domain-containing protein [Prevotella sp.]|jgi:2',3'-cyclic-nucleotide 2'-phosphodiesterase (5'-nucleotidase family)|nr:5'-nucleotidase C-terminal domain-containing protein [Prevotella sp.]